jgi:hypothetical protein
VTVQYSQKNFTNGVQAGQYYSLICSLAVDGLMQPERKQQKKKERGVQKHLYYLLFIYLRTKMFTSRGVLKKQKCFCVNQLCYTIQDQMISTGIKTPRTRAIYVHLELLQWQWHFRSRYLTYLFLVASFKAAFTNLFAIPCTNL